MASNLAPRCSLFKRGLGVPFLLSAHAPYPLGTNTAFSASTELLLQLLGLTLPPKAMDISPELKGTSIFLVGMKSSVKSSLGKLLADALRYYYFDSDSLVEEAAGGEFTAKSFKERDEKGFCESETEVLKQLSSMGRLVVCAGDGAVQSSTNLAFLRHGISLWIDIPLDMVAKGMLEEQSQLSESEIFTSEAFSELTHDDRVLGQLSALYEEMRDGYATADATVSLQKVACQLGYDDLYSVTAENMTLESLVWTPDMGQRDWAKVHMAKAVSTATGTATVILLCRILVAAFPPTESPSTSTARFCASL
ncbi:putative inactive shikimate kinase like 1, chloroplastic [Morella rubra]|uniref:Putative inactive shikimate kinase like 1, chloroplastic n=1 Tax=Morella rubra TaxID=262757 RepID=A0A6A1UR13_9ROSI|nr:putative inactive shikimate kinase like 1, chloroplastic [Morella rubra]